MYAGSTVRTSRPEEGEADAELVEQLSSGVRQVRPRLAHATPSRHAVTLPLVAGPSQTSFSASFFQRTATRRVVPVLPSAVSSHAGRRAGRSSTGESPFPANVLRY